MDPKVRRTWEDFLNPEITRTRLLAAAVYIAAFETLKGSVVNRLRDFYWTGFDETGDHIDPKYQSAVLSRNRSPVLASLDWLTQSKALDDADLRAFERVKACRNRLAHQLFATLGSDGLPADFAECFASMVDLLRKIEVWWITNVEIPTDPDYDGSDVDEAGIVPGPIMSIRLLYDIALGDEAKSRFYYNGFREQSRDG